MKESGRANALLVELLLVILFFMISASILVQVFADARQKSRTASAVNASMLDAQNIAEDLYASDDPEAVLAGYGFTADGDGWVVQKEGYRLKVAFREEATGAGVLRTYDVTGTEITHDNNGIEKETVLLTLPSTRYIPREVSP